MKIIKNHLEIFDVLSEIVGHISRHSNIWYQCYYINYKLILASDIVKNYFLSPGFNCTFVIKCSVHINQNIYGKENHWNQIKNHLKSI